MKAELGTGEAPREIAASEGSGEEAKETSS
jgi:hypothetical protein